ncbi:MAG: SH3 domain-containing protein, partial [Chitinophagaceae bacterium]|nr:SH3 domain-containing protein [Anaerolineae bacterium]
MKVKSKALLILVMISLLLGVFVSGSVLAGDRQQQTRFVAPILVANTSFLNVRSGPGVQFTVTVTVVGGTELPVLGVASDLTWYQISTIVGPGWVNVQYTLPRGDFSNVPFVSVDSFAQAQVGGGFGVAGLGQGGGATSVGGVSVAGVGVNTRVG